ncbi:hypothetical protein [Bacillus amyloliquefaciens]|uniref:hypothetical protein n=2 Tax=Bacillus amyloliquefaciens group TaxID=1938374 RepID=UPI001404C786|nr:hypothetical protein [Bacillus amyloliquefaciens]NHN20927.1 hypothetical protein [Bacillus amyloliquefaciens]
MITYKNNFKSIKNYFLSKNIDITKPGFYDDEKFIEIEKSDSTFLNNYAKFVLHQEYSEEYKEKANKILSVIADILYQELESDGRQNACVDMAGVLSRILESEGIWNYIVFGALTVDFPKSSGLTSVHYWPISSDFTSRTAAHAWCVVPPFGVVDLTIKQQGFSNAQNVFIPDYIIEKESIKYTAKINDLIDDLVRLGNPGQPIGYYLKDFSNFTKTFKPVKIQKEATFKYIPVSISAPDLPLEKIKGLKLNGQYGIDIYETKIKSALVK